MRAGEKHNLKKMKPAVSRVLVLVFTLGFTYAQPGADPFALTDTLISEGLKNNPRLMAIQLDTQAAETEIIQAGTLPDPILSISANNLPVDVFTFDKEPMTGKMLQLSQGIPILGKLNLRSQIAETRHEVSIETLEEARNQLKREIATLVMDISYTDAAIETIERNKQLLDEFQRVAGQRYAVGKGLQQDVLKAQVELSRMMEREITLRQRRITQVEQLNQALDRPVQSTVPPIANPGFSKLSLELTELVKTGVAHRPALRAMESKIKQSAQLVDLAKKNLVPDLKLNAGYTQRDVLQSGQGGSDFLSAGVSVTLPLYAGHKQKQAISESKIRKSAQEERYRDAVNQLEAALESTLSSLSQNADLIDLYADGIIPQAAQSLESALTGYQTDKVDFITLINNQITLLNLELEYARILTNYHKDIVKLEYLIGQQLIRKNPNS